MRFRTGWMVLLWAGPVFSFVEPLPLTASTANRQASVVREVGRLRGGVQVTACSGDETASSVSIAERLDAVQALVRKASHASQSQVRLVAVSKLQSNEAILAAHAAGQRVFGENYVQELVSKAPQLPEDISWHFIGMLQSNKAKGLVAGVKNLAVVESVHSVKTASALEKACEVAAREPPLKVMIQVLTSGEESKSGCKPSEAVDIARHIVHECPRLSLSGLMTIGKFGDPNPEPYFELLKQCRAEIAEALGREEHSLELSMGMSGDFQKAIECGSSSVRVGTSIFGARPSR